MPRSKVSASRGTAVDLRTTTTAVGETWLVLPMRRGAGDAHDVGMSNTKTVSVRNRLLAVAVAARRDARDRGPAEAGISTSPGRRPPIDQEMEHGRSAPPVRR